MPRQENDLSSGTVCHSTKNIEIYSTKYVTACGCLPGGAPMAITIKDIGPQEFFAIFHHWQTQGAYYIPGLTQPKWSIIFSKKDFMVKFGQEMYVSQTLSQVPAQWQIVQIQLETPQISMCVCARVTFM